jgi:predicted metalloprotease with PDZ domain
MNPPIPRVRRVFALATLAPLAALLALAAAAESPMPAGYPGRGRIGIEVQPMTAELREFFGAPTASGILIVRVEGGRPAHAARLKVGDVVVAAADEPLVRPQDLVAIVARAPGGAPLELKVIRKGRTRSIQVVPDGEPASSEALQAWHERMGGPPDRFAPPAAAAEPGADAPPAEEPGLPHAPIQPVAQPDAAAPLPAGAPALPQ